MIWKIHDQQWLRVVNNTMFRLGLTGSIATGKSTVLNMFAKAGYATFSADEVVHGLYAGQAAPVIKSLCPDAVKDNRVDRKILAEFLIKNPSEIKNLEALIHPLVHEKYHKFIAMAQNRMEKLVIIDIPLLFEIEFDYELDAIAVTFCDSEEQKRRAMARKGMTEEKYNNILMHQMGQEEKKRRADYLIDTNNTLEQTQVQVTKIIRTCLNSMNISG